MISRFLVGFNIVFSGRKILISTPGIKLWILLPYIIQILMLGMGLFFGVAEIKALTLKMISFFFADPTSGVGITVYYLIFIVFALVFSVIYFYFIYLISLVVASPFYSIITEKTLVHLNVIKPRSSWRESVKVALKMIRVSAIKSIFFILIGVLLFISSFIPIVNLLAAYCAFLIIAFDTSDFAFEALEMNLSERILFFKNNLLEYMGMATFVGLTALLPGLILFVMPLAVLGSVGYIASQKMKTR